MIPPSCRIPTGLKRGDKGPGPRVLQEWLHLNGQRIEIDSDFGPATQRALARVGCHGPTDEAIVQELTTPMRRALAAKGSILEVAAAYLRHGCREVGGQNKGPWCRLIAGDAHEGEAWCGHYLKHIARQAGIAWADRISSSCDTLGWNARQDGRLSTVPEVGGLFLVRGPSRADPWTHTGLVTAVHLDADGKPEAVSTNEGNSNVDGSREGREVCARVRGLGRLDFVRLSP